MGAKPTAKRIRYRREGVGRQAALGIELERLYGSVLSGVGALEIEPAFLDLDHTPGRVARMLRDELLSSYQNGALEQLVSAFTCFPAEGKQEMVVVGDIPFYSLCAHHIIPFFGYVYIGYIPKELIAGLSKLPRAVDYFSRKLQVQERLTSEIADFLEKVLKPRAVCVHIEARHLCMEARGIRKPGTKTMTTALRGEAFEAEIRDEFYRLIGK